MFESKNAFLYLYIIIRCHKYFNPIKIKSICKLLFFYFVCHNRTKYILKNYKEYNKFFKDIYISKIYKIITAHDYLLL